MKQKGGEDRKMRKAYRVYMDQTSVDNPFGPNYFKLSQNTKISYKYNLMKDYILLSDIDKQKLQNEQLYFLGILIAGLTGGYALGFITQKLLFKPQNWNSFFNLIIMGGSFTFAYFKAHERYSHQVFTYNKQLVMDSKITKFHYDLSKYIYFMQWAQNTNENTKQQIQSLVVAFNKFIIQNHQTDSKEDQSIKQQWQKYKNILYQSPSEISSHKKYVNQLDDLPKALFTGFNYIKKIFKIQDKDPFQHFDEKKLRQWLLQSLKLMKKNNTQILKI